jgi:hypothetical protein
MLFKFGWALVVAGLVAVGIGANTSEPLDLAVAVAPGWHVTVFVPGTATGVLLLLAGAVTLVVSAVRARRAARGPQAN